MAKNQIAAIFIENAKGNFFIHRRLSTKHTFPNKFGIGAGVFVHPGEFPVDAARRELEEETGLVVPLRYVCTVEFDDPNFQQTSTSSSHGDQLDGSRKDSLPRIGSQMRIISVCLFTALAGCAGTSSGVPLQQNLNAISIRKADSQSYDYVVSIPDAKDNAYDPGDKATRDKMALTALKDQCEAPQIVGESVINTGTYLLGNISKSFEMQVRC